MALSAQIMTDDSKKWVEERSWANGWDVAPDKSINSDEFFTQYTKNKELWDAMFKFLSANDLKQIDLGEHQIVPGRCWAIVSEYTPKTTDKGNIESHKKFIDLQYVMHGNEKMGLADSVTVKKEYNPDRDVAFWNSDDVRYFNATPESFFLFFPCDIHQPSVQADGDVMQSRKVVIKIEYKD
ncbi:MAG: DUF386 domain-containing protein [Bacteroidales bacterium]|nr:DUF386 domain-containing protein [Bacteroidales bacterium]